MINIDNKKISLNTRNWIINKTDTINQLNLHLEIFRIPPFLFFINVGDTLYDFHADQLKLLLFSPGSLKCCKNK